MIFSKHNFFPAGKSKVAVKISTLDSSGQKTINLNAYKNIVYYIFEQRNLGDQLSFETLNFCHLY